MVHICDTSTGEAESGGLLKFKASLGYIARPPPQKKEVKY